MARDGVRNTRKRVTVRAAAITARRYFAADQRFSAAVSSPLLNPFLLLLLVLLWFALSVGTRERAGFMPPSVKRDQHRRSWLEIESFAVRTMGG